MKPLLPWYKFPLAYFQIASHLSIIPMVMYATGTQWIIALVVYFLMGGWGLAITYHRLVTHRSFESPTWFKMLGLLFGTLCGAGSTIQWVAQHRQHHAYSDGEKDPHRPSGSIKNFLQVYFAPYILPVSPKFAVDLLRDPLHKKIHDHYWKIQLVYVIILGCIDPFAIIYAYLFPACIVWHAIAWLGTFAHTPGYGYQTYDTGEYSQNMWLVALLAFGEGWHNNHHAKPNEWRFGHKWWEFDLSGFIIKLIKK